MIAFNFVKNRRFRSDFVVQEKNKEFGEIKAIEIPVILSLPIADESAVDLSL